MKQNIYKNAGFPPIKYCSTEDLKKTSKERFIGSVPDVNIKDLLKINKNPIININDNNDALEVVSELNS
jgi:hypothetical protein